MTPVPSILSTIGNTPVIRLRRLEPEGVEFHAKLEAFIPGWSVRRLFAAAGIPYRSVDLDGPEWRAGTRAGAMRRALLRVTGQPTIPQVFVGGAPLGGATETMAAFADGPLPARPAGFGIALDPAAVADPKAFLPAWLHPRGAAAAPAPAGAARGGPADDCAA